MPTSKPRKRKNAKKNTKKAQQHAFTLNSEQIGMLAKSMWDEHAKLSDLPTPSFIRIIGPSAEAEPMVFLGRRVDSVISVDKASLPYLLSLRYFAENRSVRSLWQQGVRIQAFTEIVDPTMYDIADHIEAGRVHLCLRFEKSAMSQKEYIEGLTLAV